MRRVLWIGLVLCAVTVVLAGCFAGPNEMARTENDEGEVAGFWAGLWHGIVSPFLFVISLFAKGVHFYEVHNNGNWYNFGFVLGAGILTGGGGLLGSRKRRSDD